MVNKKGQELSTGTIILLILGVIILVLLAIGFTYGWNKILPFISQSNVDTVVSQCGVACSTDSVYDYCKSPRDLIPTTTSDKIKGATCYYLATRQATYGIENCNIDCEASVKIFTEEEKIPATNVEELRKVCFDSNNQLHSEYAGKMLQMIYTGKDKINRLLSAQCPTQQ